MIRIKKHRFDDRFFSLENEYLNGQKKNQSGIILYDETENDLI